MGLTKISVEFEGDAKKSHVISFGDLRALPALIAEAEIGMGRCLIVTDSNVGPLYAGAVQKALEEEGWLVKLVTLPAGESTKSLESLGRLLDEGLGFRMDRQSPVIALGGGVIGDVAGFAAAVLLRGVPLVHVPTSLLAQVDSSIGGKTGINHLTGKNLVGAFHQPSMILIDQTTLSTLPQEELLGGLAEVVKTALLADAHLVDYLTENWDAVVAREAQAIATVVRRCAEIKVSIVVGDEKEAGRRALLNLGHTFGHAIEKVAGYQTVTHGVAVAAGMRSALELSAARYPEVDFAEARRLVERLPLPSSLANLSVDALIDAMLSDKKRSSGRLRFILLEKPGSAVVVDDVTRAEIVHGFESVLGPLQDAAQ